MIRHEIERHLVQPQEMKSFYTLTRCSTGLMVICRTASVTRRGPVGLGNALCYHAACSGWRFRSIQNVKFLAPLIPETTVTLQLTWQETSQVLTFCYQRHDGDARHTASSRKIRLCR